jgi:hypothetical protein
LLLQGRFLRKQIIVFPDGLVLGNKREQRKDTGTMPLVHLETCVFPEDLFSLPALHLGNEEGWWVLHTKPRAEKSLARRLLGKDIGFFLPLYHKKLNGPKREFFSHLPLFPSYLFLYGGVQTRLKALETNLVVKCLNVPDQEKLHKELRFIHQLISSDFNIMPENRLVPGTPVQVIKGPLAGLEGKVVQGAKNWKLVIEVEFLQQGVSVEIESGMIQPLIGDKSGFLSHSD